MFKKNQEYKNFIITNYVPIKEIKCELIELKHKSLDSQIIKIKNEDDENLFSLSFKTYPKDSSGAPHILEHIVLCGSKKFPVKDPFFSMLKRSLNTFMNAMTGPDFTCYPAASTVEKDFYNLLEVYLDAVFNPKLDKMSFLQEGHRFEFSSSENALSDLTYKGVVYNEMKGSMANPDNILMQKMFENLTPGLPYAFNAGGDPKKIPDLTYEQLKEFHQKYYHPSRCLFFFYGNLDLKKQLDFIEKNILKGTKTEKNSIIGFSKQKRFSKPKFVEDRYPVSENEPLNNKSIISFGYLTCFIENQIDLYGIALLDIILMGTDGSFLKLALMQSNLCTQVDSYFDTEMTEAVYIFVCKGCNSQNKDAILNVIKSTLKKITEIKIPKEIIDAALHQLEFSRTEINHDNGPYGLILFFRAALAKQHGIAPETTLVIHTLFKILKEKLQNPNFLTDLIKKYFLDNTHLVELVLNPDNHLNAEMLHEEEEKLNQIQSNLFPNQIEQIIKDTKDLKTWQKKLEETSLECLPKIDIKDVPKKNKNYPLNMEEVKKYKIFHHDVFTNDILYVDLLFDLPFLTFEEISLLPLFSSIVTNIGANSRSYVENLNFIQAYTGGLASYLTINISAKNPDDFIPSIAIKSKALYRNADKLFNLIKDTITNPIFNDTNRIKELLLQQYTFLENSIVKNSMSYAKALSNASLSFPAYLVSFWYGIDYFKRLKELIKNLDKNLLMIIDQLNILKTKIFCINNAHLVISSCKNKYLDLKKNNFYGILDIEFKNTKSFVKNFEIEKIKSHTNFIPAPVAFTASSYKTVGFLHDDAPFLLIASYIFENKILHKKIREEGGAYGSGASFSATNGIFTFSSYRDPHIKSTLDTFKLAIKEITNKNFTQDDLYEAKLGVIQNVDTPISPGLRAIIAYALLRSGKTAALRQKFRDKVLNAKKEDIISAVEKHLFNQIDKEIAITFCGKEIMDR
jgi:Zn-dependent M16 (insulinase) family peptidase